MLFQTSPSRADGSVEAKFSEYAQKKFTPALLQGLHNRNVSLCSNHLCGGWTCTPECNAPPPPTPMSVAALCGDCAGWSPCSLELTPSRRSSCVSLPADQSAPAAHRCHTQTMKWASKTALLSSWGVFLSGLKTLRFIKNFHYFSVLPDIPKIQFNPVGKAGNELDKELPVKWPSWIYCLFVVSPCSGRSSLCAENNLTQPCYFSEAEECK